MIMNRILLVIILVTGIVEVSFAQDPQFSQYYQAPLYLNPGFAGITTQHRIGINHRIQWPGLPQAFSTYAMSYDIFLPEIRSGIGIIATTDKMGSAGWRTTTAGIMYSYKVKLAENLVFSPGLYFGYGTNGLDRTKLVMGDGLEYNGLTLDPEVAKIGKQSYFDIGSGFLLYSKNLFLGAAFSHMNQPNLSLLNDDNKLPMKTSVHGGARINLRGAATRTTGRMSYLTPSFIYRTQGKSFSQLDFGVNYHVDPVSIGIWYRGKPFESTVINTVEQDALIIQMGMYFKNLTVGYSYDFTVSKMQTASGGAHELSIVMEFQTRPTTKKKKYKLIPCPTFNSKPGFWN